MDRVRGLTRRGRLRRNTKYHGGAQEGLTSGRVPYELIEKKEPKVNLKPRRMVYGGTRKGKGATIVRKGRANIKN
jgi:hypothetical protein